MKWKLTCQGVSGCPAPSSGLSDHHVPSVQDKCSKAYDTLARACVCPPTHSLSHPPTHQTTHPPTHTHMHMHMHMHMHTHTHTHASTHYVNSWS